MKANLTNDRLANNVAFYNSNYAFGHAWETRNYGDFVKFIKDLLTINDLELYRGHDDPYYQTKAIKSNQDLIFNFATNDVQLTKALAPRFANKIYYHFDFDFQTQGFTITNQEHFSYPNAYVFANHQKYLVNGARIVSVLINQDWKNHDLFYSYLQAAISNYFQNEHKLTIVSFNDWLEQSHTKSKKQSKSKSL